MTVLSDSQIIRYLKNKQIIVHPILDREQISGARIGLRLDNRFFVFRYQKFPLCDPVEMAERKLSGRDLGDFINIPYGENIYIHPGEFVIAEIFERISIPRTLVGNLDGRVSLARLGIVVHAAAAGINPGFSGRLACQISNMGKIPVALYPLMIIASLSFQTVEGEVSIPDSLRHSDEITSTLIRDKEIQNKTLVQMKGKL